MIRLPRASEALVEETKVRGYLLDAGHPRNGGKAAFFAAFRFDDAVWTSFRDALRHHVTANPVVASSISRHGTKHVVRCALPTPDARDPCITTVWIVEQDRPPRLVTAYP
jgi:hypothetical protein